MLSFVYLPVFIISVYVSGSAINEIETSVPSIIHNTERTFITGSGRGTVILTISSAETSPFTVISERSTTTSARSLSIPSTTSTTSLISASSIASSPLPGTASTAASSLSAPAITTSFSFRALNVLPTRKFDLRTTTFPGVEATDDDLNITSQAGTHAYLPCNVKQLVKKPLSWIRVRDGHILTVDQTTFIADQRFQSIFSPNPERWSLQIKYVQEQDAGSYECQVSTEPKMSARVRLHVVVPRTEPFGESNRHVKAGSQVILRCIVSEALEPPLFFNWYFDKKQIFLHTQNSWWTEIDRQVVGNSSDKQNTVASLIIPSVTKKDSGNYTCSPSNSESITFVLHVLNGEYSASAITSRSRNMLEPNLARTILILFSILTIFKNYAIKKG